jgi:hypothetical protein
VGADEAVHRGRGGGGQPAVVSLSRLSAGNGASGVGVATGSTVASLNGRSDTTRDWFISDLDLGSNGEGSYEGLLPLMRSSRQ